MKTDKQKIAVMQAFEDGKSVRVRADGHTYNKNYGDRLIWNWPHCDYEVVREPVQVVHWVNVYPDHEVTHLSEKIANMNAGVSRIACVKLTGEYMPGERDDE